MSNPVGRPATEPCGTVAAYKRHKRRGEDACQRCKDAYNAAHREMYAKRKGIS